MTQVWLIYSKFGYNVLGEQVLVSPEGTGIEKIIVDGDERKILPIDQSVDIGFRLPYSSYERPLMGREISTEFVPRRIKIKHIKWPKSWALYSRDFDVQVGDSIVSQDFKDIVEAHDRDVHQFIPITLEDTRGRPIEKEYYWFAPRNRVFALNPDKVQGEVRYFSPDKPGWVNPHKDRLPAMVGRVVTGKKTLSFHADRIGDRDLFCDGEVPGEIFISDRLRHAFADAGLIGLTSYGPHPVR